MISWAEICDHPSLKDLPFKVETNRYGKIVMSPGSNWQSSLQYDIGRLLDDHMPGGRVMVECAIETSDGTRVADVAWMSQKRHAPHRRAMSLPIAPEVCVEVLSRSNTREEMIGKMQLYFERGAQEVWLCTEKGKMEFFLHDEVASVKQSRLCPAFPKKIDC